MRPAVAIVALVLLVVACGGGAPKKLAVATTTTTTTTSITTTSITTTSTTVVVTTTTTPATTAPAPAPYAASIAAVTADDLGASWHEGSRRARQLADAHARVHRLRRRRAHWSGRRERRRREERRRGVPPTPRGWVPDSQDEADLHAGGVRRLRDARRQLDRLLVSVNDSGTPSWSQHAFGHAIDINPIENPYIEGDRIIPSAGAAYTDRSDVRPGMAVRTASS